MKPRRLLLAVLALSLSFAGPVLSVRAQDDAAKEEVKPAKKKKAVKKKTFDYERSKYKSREPSQTPTYKFNEKGEPIKADAKKKVSAKKKRSEPPEAELKEGSEACGSEDTCAQKKTEADAL